MANQTIKEQILEVLADPMNLPSVFWDYATQSWLKDAPVFPISQVFGFTQFTVQSATPIATTETTTSLTAVDLATTGPSLSTLPSGNYLIMHGALIRSSVSNVGAFMSVSVNGAIDSNHFAYNDSTNAMTVSHAYAASLTAATNTIVSKYNVNGVATGTFSNRWVLALKYGNV